MGKIFIPFDEGAGASVFTAQWSKMMRSVFRDGVVNNLLDELLVYADSTGMQVKIMSGAAWIKGHYYENDSEETLAIAAADATLTRWDIVVLEVDWTKTDNQMSTLVVTGTPAASPSLPSLTQNTSKWQIPLAKIIVEAGVSTVAAEKVSDMRIYKFGLGWDDPEETWTYASSTSFTVVGNKTKKYTPGMKWKAILNSVEKQGYLVSSSYNSGTNLTTVNTVGDALTDYAITYNLFSTHSNPAGFIHNFDYVPTLNGGSAVLSGYTSARFSIVGRKCKFDFLASNKSVTGTSGVLQISLPTTVFSNAVDIRVSAQAYISPDYVDIRAVISKGSSYVALWKDFTATYWAGTEVNVHIYMTGEFEI